MQELKNGLEKFSREVEAKEFTDTLLLETADKWASHSLRTYMGETLSRALAVSKAIAEFDCALKHPESLKD